jgi:hypothetical protein
MGTKIGLRMELDDVRMTKTPYTTLDNLGRKMQENDVWCIDLRRFVLKCIEISLWRGRRMARQALGIR